MCSNSAPAAPPEQSNRNIAGEGNGEDAGGIHGIAGLDDADGAEDVHEHTHFDELFGMKGPVFCLVKNPSIVLLGIMEFLGVVIFVPFSLVRIILYYVSWVFSSASGPVLSTVIPLTETALPLANITLKNAFSVVTNLTSEGQENGFLGQVAEIFKVNTCGITEAANNTTASLSADILIGATMGTSWLSHVTTLAIGYMFIFSLVFFYFGIKSRDNSIPLQTVLGSVG
ncbi:hypothetical protein LWI29_020591 [Acer saccharum]|uniref:RING-type E3 ubiquitin transferase n=1 Tax=Acer saccharum TaxID=4024 RepID=A0AA39SEH5_ACESA|nr:hypothetical protein LWI29_020591 [Acer saccharum]